MKIHFLLLIPALTGTAFAAPVRAALAAHTGDAALGDVADDSVGVREESAPAPDLDTYVSRRLAAVFRRCGVIFWEADDEISVRRRPKTVFRRGGGGG